MHANIDMGYFNKTAYCCSVFHTCIKPVCLVTFLLLKKKIVHSNYTFLFFTENAELVQCKYALTAIHFHLRVLDFSDVCLFALRGWNQPLLNSLSKAGISHCYSASLIFKSYKDGMGEHFSNSKPTVEFSRQPVGDRTV